MRREVKKDGSTVLDGMSVKDIILAAHPVGSYYMSNNSTSPATLFGGTWTRVKGRVIVGLDEADTSFDVAGETGGEKTHTLTVAEMPYHTHAFSGTSTSGFYNGGTATAGSNPQRQTGATGDNTGGNGGGGAHNNLQPYIVAYMWRRTA